MLSEEPERLRQIKGISPEKARKISQEFNSQMVVRTVMISLESYIEAPHECIELYKTLGASAVAAEKITPIYSALPCRAFRLKGLTR